MSGPKHLAVRLFPGAAAGGQGCNVYNGPPGDPARPQAHLGTVNQEGSSVEGLAAVDQEGDWMKLEQPDGSELGWIEASPAVVVPLAFPAFYRFSASLPENTELRVRHGAAEDAPLMGTLKAGALVYGLSLQGPWLRIALFGDGTGDFTEAFMMTSVQSRATLIPVVPSLYMFAPDLPNGCSLRVRSNPHGEAPEIATLTNEYLLQIVDADTSGDVAWLRVILPNA
eukprot:CAMPEP_0119511022 /NCGR_PEP_ID=MMETSP1344-20130328/29810_1 /TAXON_ID=236787 /ORGANISM="Florenciella parvula, Strain CCMP2471" /LENGTH=225 /DNA_ID=CAMNT_0007547983 /DNA_START=14 /DNA_END=687 /DNA_ORIENTATION=-